MLSFFRYRTKLYAKTPAGEIAFGDVQGLYEWRGSQLIIYTGGDRQAAMDGQMLTTTGRGLPRMLGFREAVRRHNTMTN